MDDCATKSRQCVARYTEWYIMPSVAMRDDHDYGEAIAGLLKKRTTVCLPYYIHDALVDVLKQSDQRSAS